MCIYKTFVCPSCQQWVKDKLYKCINGPPGEGANCGNVNSIYNQPHWERCRQCHREGRGRDYRREKRQGREPSPAGSEFSVASTVYPESSISGYHGAWSRGDEDDDASLYSAASERTTMSGYADSLASSSYIDNMTAQPRPSHSQSHSQFQSQRRGSSSYYQSQDGRSEMSYAPTDSGRTTAASRSSRRPSHSDHRSRKSSRTSESSYANSGVSRSTRDSESTRYSRY